MTTEDRTRTDDDPATGEAEALAQPATGLPALVALLLGVLGAAVGLAPWLVHGARLPLQNLWAEEARPEAMPIALLPFSQYDVVTIAALLVVGSAVAGIAGRALRSTLTRTGVAALVGGAVLVQLVALAQSTIVTASGLQDSRLADLYLALLLGVATLAILLGLPVLLLIARAPRAGALLGLAVAAIAAASWLSTLVAPLLLGTPGTEAAQAVLLPVIQWTPAVLVGAAIGWAGLGSVGRAGSALVALALLWAAPALITGAASAAGTRVLARDPAGIIEVAAQITVLSLTDLAVVVPRLAVAVVVAAALLGVRALRRRRER